MKDLQGADPILITLFTSDELERAGVERLQVKVKSTIRSETTSGYIGYLTFADGTIAVFCRRMTCWSVRLNRALPFNPASEMNQRIGSDVRAFGHPGGTFVPPQGCNEWHVDTQEGLRDLVRTLKAHFGEARTTRPSSPPEWHMLKKLVNNVIVD